MSAKTKAERDRLLDRIRKILAKVGRGATEEEAETAIAMARRLMEEHQIAEADLDAGPDAWADVRCHEAARMPPEAKYVCTILRRHFFVRPLVGKTSDGRDRLHIFGEPAAADLAVWLYGRLVDQYRSLFRAFRARTGVGSDVRPGYYAGLTAGLDGRLAADRRGAGADRPGVNEIVLADREAVIDAAMAERFPSLKHSRAVAPRKVSAEGFLGGLADSRNLSVARPLGAGGGSKALPGPSSRPDKQESFF